MAYNDSCTITRASARGNFVDGEFVPSTDTTVVYDGACDLQDRPRSIERRFGEGTPEADLEAKLYFPLNKVRQVIGGSDTQRVKLNDLVDVQPYIGPMRRGRISAVRLLDYSITVRWAKEL